MRYFSLAIAAVIFLIFFGLFTSVDLNTVQVTNMAQLHSFVFEDCHKSYFNSIHDADPCPRVLWLTTVARLISIRSSSCLLVVCGKNL